MIFPAFDLSLGTAILVFLAAYLLGSVPFGMLLSRIMGLGDLRSIGSGNIGATNVLRTGSKLAAFLTLAFDMGKGALAVIIARSIFGETAAQLAGLAAILGHCFPIWLRFKGGKGVATFLGIVLALSFPVGMSACALWLIGAFLTRISSAAALISAFLTPFVFYVFGLPSVVALAIAFMVLIFFKHRENIDRLLAGAEPKIGKKK